MSGLGRQFQARWDRISEYRLKSLAWAYASGIGDRNS